MHARNAEKGQMYVITNEFFPLHKTQIINVFFWDMHVNVSYGSCNVFIFANKKTPQKNIICVWQMCIK